VRITSVATNLSPITLEDLVLKEHLDWDVDGDFPDDVWDYDDGRHLILGRDGSWVGIASFEAPDFRDASGWHDYWRRETTVDWPSGPTPPFDGAPLLHFESGSVPPGANRGVTVTLAAAPDRATLEAAVDGVAPPWLTASTGAGTLPPGSTTDVDLHFDATRLAIGEYRSEVVVSSDDPQNEEIRIPVVLTVSAPGATPGPLAVDLPTVRAFRPAAPNPFSSATVLRFDLPRPAAVRLRIYDVAGRAVRTLVDRPVEPGRHEVRWEGRDDRGRAVAGGVYFARLETGDFHRTRKILRLPGR
jgi:hypothetical protein